MVGRTKRPTKEEQRRFQAIQDTGKTNQTLDGEFRLTYNKKEKVTMSKETVNEVSSYTIRAIPDRGISLEVATHYGIRTAVSPTDGVTPVAYYFPYTTEGEVVGYKKKDLTIEKGDRYHFTTIGKVTADTELFGQSVCSGGRKLYITEGECFPEDAEILTDSGWKTFEELSTFDKVAQWHVDHTISWTTPLNYVKKKWSGNLLQYKNKGYVSRTTPNHKLVSIGYTGEVYTHTAEDGPTGTGHLVPRGGFLFGEGIPLKNEQIALCLAVCADATIDYRQSGERYARFRLKKDRKIKRLSDLLDSLGIRYSCNRLSDGYMSICFTIPEYATGKHFDWEWVKIASVYQRDFILNELTFWDGNRVPNRNQTEFSSKHKDLANWVQVMAHTTGYCSSIIERSNQYGHWYKVSILRGKQHSSWQVMKNRKEYIPYSGFVYCVSVPSGHIIVRQDDKVTVSGNCDAAALYEVLINRVKGTKYEGMTPNVTSIGLGTSNAARHISSNMDFLERFQEVILVFDQDEATPAERKKGILKGWDAVAEVSHLIPEVKVARLSKNDPCDMVKAGKQKELGDAVLFNSERYRPKGILSGTEISLEKLREVRPRGIGLPFPELDKKMRGLRLGELTVLIAPAKSGKSTVVSEIEYHLNKHHEQKVAAIHLEAGYEEAARNQIALDNNVLPDHLAENPYMIPEEDYVKSYNELVANGRYFSVSHWGSLNSEELLDKIRHFAIVERCKFVILDHISMIFSGMMSRDERQDIDWLLTQMAQMVVELNIHIIAVAHIKRSNNKNFYEGAVPTLSDARGSGAFEQLAWNCISVARNHMAEDNDRITLHLLANRKARRTGECDTLIYDQNTGRLRVEEQEY